MAKNKLKKTKGQGKNLRTMILMSLLCVSLISGATYAWFTLSNSASINNMTMQVADVGGGLQISSSGSSYEASFTASSPSGKLLPANLTATSGNTFDKLLGMPVYEGNSVPGIIGSKVVDYDKSGATELTGTGSGYYFKQDFWLQDEGMAQNETGVEIHLQNASGLTSGTASYKEDGMTAFDGTYVVGKFDDPTKANAAALAAASVRIVFYEVGSDGAETFRAVYEPNSDINTNPSTRATVESGVSTNVPASTIAQKTDGSISTDAALCTLKKDATSAHLRMYVYLEGNDPQCANEMAAGNVVFNFKFVEKAVTTP